MCFCLFCSNGVSQLLETLCSSDEKVVESGVRSLKMLFQVGSIASHGYLPIADYHGIHTDAVYLEQQTDTSRDFKQIRHSQCTFSGHRFILCIDICYLVNIQVTNHL